MGDEQADKGERLVDDGRLVTLDVVANASMNRRRGLGGVNSYARELRMDIAALLRARASRAGQEADGEELSSSPKGARLRWIDLCCGEGIALAQAARELRDLCGAGLLEIEGLDLVPLFARDAVECPYVRLESRGVHTWEPGRRYDLITCVHGLHYVGDRLTVLVKAARALHPGGQFVASFDLADVHLPGGRKRLLQLLHERGFTYDGRARLLRCTGDERSAGTPDFPLRLIGADPQAGPNYTHQPVVSAWYENALLPPARA